MARLRKIDASLDRQIIVGMVVSDRFLQSIQSIYRPELFTAPFAVTVASWCLEYGKRYNKAPKQHIQDIFASHQRAGLDDAQSDLIEQFLKSLQDEYEHAEKFNVDYLLDQTEKLFRQRTIKHLAEDLEAHLSRGEVEDAEGRLVDFRKLARPASNSINPLRDVEALQKAFEAREEPLFRLPGAYGELLNPHLIRGGFVAFLGRAKVGKTWRLMDIAMRAVADRCNVAFFQLGDLSQDDYLVRQGVYLAKVSNDAKYCGDVLVPVLDCKHNQIAECRNGGGREEALEINLEELLPNEEKRDWIYSHTPCQACRKLPGFQGATWWDIRPKTLPLTWQKAWDATQRWSKRHRAKGFRLATYPNSSVNVAGVEQQLDLWEQTEGFIPDVIILDYADIMLPENDRKEQRHQENDRWKALRRLCQERYVCLITATQANRGGFGEDSLGAENTSEDKRKLDHVTAFFGLNQTPDEEEQGVLRIAPILMREGKKGKSQVAVLQSLETGQPHVASYWWRPKTKKKEK